MTRLTSLAVVLALCGSTGAQSESQRAAFPGFYSGRDDGPSPSDYQTPVKTPTVYAIARRPYTRYWGADQSCQSRGPDYRRLQMVQARRDAESARRQKSRAALPMPIYDTEKLALAKFNAAHQLWQGGNSDAARKWLETVVKEYSATEAAERARLTLARL
jgi:hypothetical protein